ncbi:MAG: helix-turn-helix domain-containing protein, partial [Prolixibacteraceae bacterium]|nr:helix-turn-helix domain-containing protein [Prolixibacteraceae bacterium]
MEANLQTEQFGVSELASEMGLSRSHIHRRLKPICNKSVSQFIREIRLEKAKELLQEGNLTVSEIAFKVGFGSPTYFIKSFHDYFGYPPGEYIKYAPEFLQTEENNKNPVSNNPEVNKTGISLKWMVSAFIIISIAVATYFIFQNRNNRGTLERSIAILPLNYVGNDPEVQILADGIVEDILNRLSQLPTLIVKSRNSSEFYRNTEKLTPEIANELRVSYLGEGTIFKEGEKVRIYIQLIDAKNDKHIWSKQYDNDLSGIFDFISLVSLQIAREMETALTVNETEQLEKIYTNNPEAFQLHQKGRFFWQKRGEENLNLSIQYFNKAMKLDSSYALAYSGLANVYMVLPFHSSFPNNEAYAKTIEYANKALSIDENLDEPHFAIAAAEMYYKLNWPVVEKEFLKAIELNSNNAETYMFYAEYLHIVCNHNEARKSIEKAIELDPNANMKYWVSSFLYYDEGKFEESLKSLEKMREFDVRLDWVYRLTFQNFIHLKQNDNVLVAYLNYLEYVPHDLDYKNQVEKNYKKAGIPGILEYEINRLKKQSSVDYKWIAKFYAMLENTDSTLLYLEKEYKNPQAEGIMDIKVWIDFQFLHGNP